MQEPQDQEKQDTGADTQEGSESTGDNTAAGEDTSSEENRPDAVV